MRIKRFFATDMRQAIRMVREELGPDAVILSNNRVEGGAEIVAAIDYDESLLDRALAGDEQQSGMPPVFDRATGEGSGPGLVQKASEEASGEAAPESASSGNESEREIVWSQEPAIVQMREELHNLRNLVENQLSTLAWQDFTRRNPLHAEVLRRLVRLGLEPQLARDLVERLSDGSDAERAWHQALALLAHQLRVTDDDILSHGGMVALVGPTGVGKTTTVAKLAARFALREGQNNVGLVSTDGYRIGAQEQLLTFGRIMGVPVHTAGEGEELHRALDGVWDKRLVVIDTAGMGQRDLRLAEQLQELRSGSPTARMYLVVAGNTQAEVVEDVVQKFESNKLSGCILTKLDEATCLGEVLSVLVRHRLPVAYVTDGQRVPEDVHPARAHSLVSRAVALAEKRGEDPDEAKIGLDFNGKVANVGF